MSTETTIFANASYEGLPLIKAYNNYASIQIGNKLAVIKLDCLMSEQVNEFEFVCRSGFRRFCFSTDLDSIAFNVSPEENHKFYLLKDADYYLILISGVKLKKNKVNLDQNIIAYEKLQAGSF
jgi:hypothetical protein